MKTADKDMQFISSYMPEIREELKQCVITMAINADTIFNDNEWLLEYVSDTIRGTLELLDKVETAITKKKDI
jgi:hypothetical protein